MVMKSCGTGMTSDFRLPKGQILPPRITGLVHGTGAHFREGDELAVILDETIEEGEGAIM